MARQMMVTCSCGVHSDTAARKMCHYPLHQNQPKFQFTCHEESATEFLMAVTVDREPLLYPTSIIAALKMLFMSYYVFNICYPTEVQATMEYIQRILFEIDPGRGSRAKKSYRWCINPKVTSLYERMKESRE
ncbi:uncharacterized protein [Apostichopus japonicus]|uniref:uncharacterized protein n=1 Tax=Stichopus japonicus TaxID=307972 RepID=UPI003AB31B6C